MKRIVQLFFISLACAATASADRLDDMISPISHPTLFEDPRQLTEIRPLYAYHELDNDFVTEGGNAQVLAAQIRAKISDDFSIIAVKDGIVRLQPDAAVSDNTGFANVAAGLKYSVYRTTDAVTSLGLTYEAPIGNRDVLQGQGDGIINPFVSSGWTYGNWNFIAHSGFRLRVDNEDSSFYDFNLHTSYKVGNFYPLVELGIVHVMQDGKRLPIKDEGQDFFNLGSTGAQGETMSTLAVGGRYRIAKNVDVGAAWQFPLDRSEGSRILDYRLQTDLIYRFDLCS